MSTTEAAPKLSMDDFKRLSKEDKINHLLELGTRANELKIQKEKMDLELERLEANDDTNGTTLKRLELDPTMLHVAYAFENLEALEQAKASVHTTMDSLLRTALAPLEEIENGPTFRAVKKMKADVEAKDESGELLRQLREYMRKVIAAQTGSVGEAGTLGEAGTVGEAGSLGGPI